jgi:hypothetical protein
MEKHTISVFIDLIEKFLLGKIDAQKFRSEYIALQQKYFDHLTGDGSYEVLKMFTAVDSYCEDASLRNEYDIDEKELLFNAKEVYTNLMKF